ncbi:hypothetical protein [Xenorhabdus sp. KK7.4]|uniref:hypothetical protein n=1 Tax=Xenorhabdus sp. KK7.4 TaxID=1851572 RepID=UPI000C04FF50|nr:hypothetical protein [Xenorhabdus sp. KK7.4]PHM51496.1 hypothetical protein Xekk_03687 [Xenorhabdus sp. KK7.4]
MRYDRGPYASQDEAWEQQEEKAAHQNAIDEYLDKQANERLGKLSSKTLSDEVSALLKMAGDKRSELLDQHNDWLFDLCRAAEEQEEKQSWR